MKEWRARNRKAYDRGKRYSSRLGRAKTILAERHRTEFGLIMTMLEAEERKAAGLSE